jgi:hypothetical protein
VTEQGSQLGSYGRSVVGQPPVGDAHHPMTGELKCGVAPAVPFERGAVAVEGVAVELDDQLCLAPKEVHLEAGDRNVDGGLGKPRVPTKAKEAALELRSRFGERLVAGK